MFQSGTGYNGSIPRGSIHQKGKEYLHSL
jgi:hypothetical protein